MDYKIKIDFSTGLADAWIVISWCIEHIGGGFDRWNWAEIENDIFEFHFAYPEDLDRFHLYMGV